MPGLKERLADIRAASGRLVGPGNEADALISGYEYRVTSLPEWAAKAKLDPEVAALAWCLSSEASDIKKYPRYSWAIAEAVCNAAREISRPVSYRILHDKRFGDGLFLGRQPGRWCSTFQPPTGRHVRCAQLVLADAVEGKAPLLAKGATQWLDCRVQVVMHARKPATNPSPEDVIRRRYAEGRRWMGNISDIDPWVLMLFGRNGGVEIAKAMEVAADGRKRWNQIGS